MLEFKDLNELNAKLNREATKNIYKEQEENANKVDELKQLRAELLKEQINNAKVKRAKELQKLDEDIKRAERQKKHDDKIFLISIFLTFGSMIASVVVFLVLLLKY